MADLITLADAYDRFLAEHESSGSALDTLMKHRWMKKIVMEFFEDVPVRSLTVDRISEFRESWTFRPTTSVNTINRLRAFSTSAWGGDGSRKIPLENSSCRKLKPSNGSRMRLRRLRRSG